VSDGSGRLVQTVNLSGPELPRDIWTKVIKGDVYIVRQHGISPGPAQLAVSQVLVDVTLIEPEGFQKGGPFFTEIAALSKNSPLRTVALAVARMAVARNDGGWSCTGFLIADRLLMTNHHCVASDDECKATYVAFDAGFDPAPSNQIHCAAFRYGSPDLDFAVIELESSPGSAVPLKCSETPLSSPSALQIVEHGWEYPEEISMTGCDVTATNVDSTIVDSHTDVSYTCDTFDSSSGSPVLTSDNRVVAIHHLQFPNRGVMIGDIVQELNKEALSN
jgi:hypothetical protein